MQGKIPVVTMVWVVSRFRLKTPPGISSSCMSPLTSSGQHSRASRASQPQKSAALSPQPGGKPQKFIRTCGGIGEGGNLFENLRLTKPWVHYRRFDGIVCLPLHKSEAPISIIPPCLTIPHKGYKRYIVVIYLKIYPSDLRL